MPGSWIWRIRAGNLLVHVFTGVMTMTFLKNFIADESGASAAEYALILAIVGSAIGVAALALGGEIRDAIVGAEENVAAAQGELADAD